MTYLNFEMRFIRTFFPFLKAGASSRASLNLTWKLYLSDFSILTISSNFQFCLLSKWKVYFSQIVQFCQIGHFWPALFNFYQLCFCPILFEFVQLCSILFNFVQFVNFLCNFFDIFAWTDWNFFKSYSK